MISGQKIKIKITHSMLNKRRQKKRKKLGEKRDGFL